MDPLNLVSNLECAAFLLSSGKLGGDRCPVERVNISPKELAVKVGKFRQLKADVRVKVSARNANSVDRGVRWVSSNEKIATVNAQGQVDAVAPGLVKITATSNKDKTKSDTVAILVEGITSVEIQPKSLVIDVRQAQPLPLIAKVNGFGNFSTAVIWSSANNDIATVDNNGLVKGIAQGETSVQITAKQDNRKSATAKITVSETVRIDGVIINHNEPIDDLRVGEVKTVTAVVEGLGANSDEITWSSSNPDIATVNGQGHAVQLVAISAGNVTITATI